MAIPTTEKASTPAFKIASMNMDAPTARRRRGRRLVWRLTMLCLVVAVAIMGVAATMRSDLFGSASSAGRILTQKVERGNLLVTVTEDGSVQSASNIDVKCEVAGGSTILWIISDGTQVKEGDDLVHLDSSVIEEQVIQQKIATEKAHATQIEAEKQYESAKIAVQEYLEGTYVKDLQTLESQVTVAKENLHSAQNALLHAERMSRKGYITALQRDAQRFAVQRSELDLAAAQTAKNVLEKFTKPKTMVDLNSACDTAEARKKSEEAAHELEETRLKRLQLQFEKCTIRAPRDGMVIYANDADPRFRGGNQSAIIEEGAAVREHQAIIRLPDLKQMQVKVTVHESKVDSLSVGLPAYITIQDRTFQGRVKSVANQAEPSSFWAAAVKEYATIVTIASDPTGLRPGMTAIVEILISDLKNVLTVPIHTVVQQGDGFYCWVLGHHGPERRPVVLGGSNSRMIEIKDGLNEGDEVILTPLSAVPEARKEVKQQSDGDAQKKKFGDMPAPAAAAGSAAIGGSVPNGGPVRNAGAVPNGGPAPNGGPGSNTAGAANANRRRGSFDLMQFDKNGDKKISREEAPERIQERFDQLDTNHDGFIDAKEYAALRQRMQQMQQGGAGAGGPSGPGAPGGGK